MANPEQTQYGFIWGPFQVERVASDDRIGYVLCVRPKDSFEGAVYIRSSPKGKKWSVTGRGC